jgi:hypothetical protein
MRSDMTRIRIAKSSGPLVKAGPRKYINLDIISGLVLASRTEEL